MKTLRLLFSPIVIVLFLALSLYEGAREAWLKRKLGNAYEGPAED